MSTLTSSSPLISPSPRAKTSNFHFAPSRSPRSAPKSYTTNQRAVNARVSNSPASSNTSNVSPKSKIPREPVLEGASGSTTTKDSRPRYADAGTQYSPDGYPPTAGHKLAAATLEQQQQHSLTAGRKRKEHARSPSPSMSPAAAAASAAEPPPEPSLRVEPTDAKQRQQTKPDGQHIPERPAEEALTRTPQEARSTHGHSSAPKRPRPESGSVKVMPREYETCNPKDLGVLIANMLMELIRLNDQIPLRDGRLTRFHSRAPPGISVTDYLQRLIQHATLSPPIMLSMVYYIDRLCAMYPAFTINSLTVHRFLITAATVAAKGLSDSFWTNPTYARIGGIPVTELATLEMEFLQKVQWKIVPKPETLVDYYNSLVDRTDGFSLEPRSGDTSAGSSGDEDTSDREDGDAMSHDPT